jgi:hypothetical protein
MKPQNEEEELEQKKLFISSLSFEREEIYFQTVIKVNQGEDEAENVLSLHRPEVACRLRPECAL